MKFDTDILADVELPDSIPEKDVLISTGAITADEWELLHDVFAMDFRQIKLTIENGIKPAETIASCCRSIKDSCYIGNKFKHNIFAEWLTEKFSFCMINNGLHFYRNGVYVQGENQAERLMYRLIPDLTAANRKEVIASLKIHPNVAERQRSDARYIPFKSRIYDVKTKSFIEYSKDFVMLYKLPYDYKPDAPRCERIDKFFKQITDNDDKMITCLLEAIGNTFYTSNDYRFSVWLCGGRGTGKTTLLNLVTQLVGEDNTASLSVQELTERFTPSALYGKVMDIADDIPNAYVKDSSVFKKAVSGSRMKHEDKGKDIFWFHPFCKFWFSMNEVPLAADKSGGWYSRQIFVPLTHDFYADAQEKDTSLMSRKWTEEEMEYLVRIAVEALHKLLDDGGDFTLSERSILKAEEYKENNDHVYSFLKERYPEQSDLHMIPTFGAYQEYVRWCEKNGYLNYKLARNTFTPAVLAHYTLLKEGQKKKDGLNQRRFYLKQV